MTRPAVRLVAAAGRTEALGRHRAPRTAAFRRESDTIGGPATLPLRIQRRRAARFARRVLLTGALLLAVAAWAVPTLAAVGWAW